MQIMIKRVMLWGVLLAVSPLLANTVKVEVVEEAEKQDMKMFCSKTSEQASKKDCEVWLNAQKKTLGDRLLTAFCSSSEVSAEVKSNCMYRTVGEIKYVLRKYRTETTQGR
ncbi:MAG: hypothetical protein ACOH5I_01525 [Oligoflexus sp.]